MSESLCSGGAAAAGGGVNMAGRGFGSGFPRWRGGRGSGDFDMWQTRGGFSGPGWGPRSPRRGGAPRGYGFGFRQDSFSGGGGGRNGGQNKLPSLLSHRIYPWEPQHGSQDFEWQFGGGRRPNRQRNRKKPLKQDGQKKRKQSESATDEPDSKIGRTEAAEDNNDSGEEQETSATASDAAEGKTSVLSVKEELAQLKRKLQEKQAPSSANDAADQSEESEQAGTSTRAEAEGLSGEEGKSAHPESKGKKIRGFFEMSGVKITARRISFACSVCKFRSFYSEDMTTHLESKFHKDIFKYLTNRLDKRTTDFLQEYLKVKHKNMEKTVSRIPNHEAAICQLYKEQDMTREIGMEHFIRKVEAAHCSVCDLYIPMQHSLVQRHLRSPDHNYNRKCMMEECKKTALTVARSILNHKPVRDKLEKFMKGENPFTGDPDDQDLEDSMVAEAPEADRAEDGQGEKQEGVEETAGDDSFPAEEASEKQEQHEEQEEQEEQGEHEEQEEHEEHEDEKPENEKPEAEETSEEGKGAEVMEGEQKVEEEEEEEGNMEEEDLQMAE